MRGLISGIQRREAPQGTLHLTSAHAFVAAERARAWPKPPFALRCGDNVASDGCASVPILIRLWRRTLAGRLCLFLPTASAALQRRDHHRWLLAPDDRGALLGVVGHVGGRLGASITARLGFASPGPPRWSLSAPTARRCLRAATAAPTAKTYAGDSVRTPAIRGFRA
jgi:hypothetical protein